MIWQHVGMQLSAVEKNAVDLHLPELAYFSEPSKFLCTAEQSVSAEKATLIPRLSGGLRSKINPQ